MRVKRRGPERAPGVIAHGVADDRGDEERTEQDNDVQTVWVHARDEAGDDEQRVARQEEPDGEARLGEDDEDQPEVGQQQPLRRQKVDDVLRVEKLFELVDEFVNRFHNKKP